MIPRVIRIFRFRVGTPFLGKFGLNCQYFLFKVKLDTLTNSIMHNSVAVFIFFFIDQKCSFWANLVQNVKIVSLRLNLVASIGILPCPSLRVSSTFCRWHMSRFDTSYKGGKPFLPVLKVLVLTCVICCD